MLSARLVSWLLTASVFLTTAPQRATGDPLPVPPLPIDFAARAERLEATADPEALVQAAALRRALGQPAQASAAIERFLTQLRADPARCAPAAAAYLSEILDPALWPDPGRWQAALRSFLAALPEASPSAQLASVRARAEILLAADLWQASCPLDPDKRSDQACIERIDATAEHYARARAQRDAARRAGRRYVSTADPCYEPPLFRYVVHRRSGLARAAQDLLTRALGRLKPLPSGEMVREAQAHALFLKAEPRFEAALATRIPAGLAFDPQNPRKLEVSKARFTAWLEARIDLSVRRPREQTRYEAILALKVPAWSVAARARTAQLLFDIDDQMSHYPQPVHDRPKRKGSSFFDTVHCEPSYQLLAQFTDDSLLACSGEASELAPGSPYARTCLDLYRRLRPWLHDEALEVFTPPGWSVPVAEARSEPGDQPK